MKGAFNTWFPVLTLIVGYVIKLIEDRLTHQRALQRERENRMENRRITLEERHADFQRQILLELQDAAQDLARGAGQAHRKDTVAFKQTGTWQKQPFAADIDDRITQSNIRCIKLASRITDDSIRELTKSFRLHALGISACRTEGEADALMLTSIKELQQLHELIGQQLRRPPTPAS